eukprot:3864517-Pyramimonas_sp.AAC.2
MLLRCLLSPIVQDIVTLDILPDWVSRTAPLNQLHPSIPPSLHPSIRCVQDGPRGPRDLSETWCSTRFKGSAVWREPEESTIPLHPSTPPSLHPMRPRRPKRPPRSFGNLVFYTVQGVGGVAQA